MQKVQNSNNYRSVNAWVWNGKLTGQFGNKIYDSLTSWGLLS